MLEYLPYIIPVIIFAVVLYYIWSKEEMWMLARYVMYQVGYEECEVDYAFRVMRKPWTWRKK